ncbi:MAG TPA: NADH-quinone oxidoreductase subunit J [Acidimicrobiales bacterium]|nr:NADH-quinone oxidoreductase subunit J [Acidimicrobiales bacterium]
MAQNIFFYAIAAVMVVAALSVVTSRNVVRAALALIVVFAGVAAQFIILAAEFVAVTQILVYIGAIMVLMLFGIMLTRARIGREGDMTNDHWWVGVLTGLLLVGVMGYALVDYFGDDKLPTERALTIANNGAASNTAAVSDSIFSTYLVPFEVVSVLLLAALVGAIVIARKDR